ncbi:CDC42 small effector protein 1 isoform X1 [Bos indicus]|uniref:CDC42 small effector protein 1 n=1 Tax=Bos indicus TaxID=9915 RepID=A0ABM4S207_BOSIN
MSEFWHKLGCCVVEKPQPKKKRRRIDRTMIGEPMNFVHLTHIGSGEMGAGDGLAMDLLRVQPPLCPAPERCCPYQFSSQNQWPRAPLSLSVS